MAAPILPDWLPAFLRATAAGAACVRNARLAARAMAARWLRQLCITLACALLWGSPGLALAQQGVLPVPALTARVIDQTATLSDADKAAIEARLAAYEKEKGSQIVVLMVPTTQPEDIAAYAHRVASAWKIGRRDVGDGLLLIVAKDDRRMRIEVAKKLEGALPDLAVARILDQSMRPRFRQNDYAGGISAALDQIMRAMDGEGLPAAQSQAAGRQQEIDWMQMLALVVMGSLAGGSLLKVFMGRALGSVTTGALVGGLVFLLSGLLFMSGVAGLASFFITLFSGLGHNGGAGGGSGMGGLRGRHGPIIIGGPPFGSGWGGRGGDSWGGGFSSGGGGDFGGGGASGDW